MSEIQKKFSDLIVYNSVTNKLPDAKYDITKAFSFVEFLNYVKVLDDDNTENFEQFKLYLKNWELIDTTNNRQNAISLRGQYINFFNELLLVYSTSEEKRYFSNLDLNDVESLTNAIPFFTRKINEIVNYYRDKRNTFKKDLREYKNKGSVESVKNFTKHTILNFLESDISTITLLQPLSSIQRNLKIELEEGYDTFNDYYDVDPNNTTQTSNANDIPAITFINLDAAIADTITENGIYIEELLPFKLTVDFDSPEEQFLQREDYIDYNIDLSVNSAGDSINNTPRDTLKILYEAELSQKLTGTDYYFLSATTEGIMLSGKLFTAENEIENALNINYPTSIVEPSAETDFERDVGLYYKPTNFSILRVNGSYITKLKTDISPGLYVYPDPNKYGDIIGTGTDERDTPYNFFFDESSYKNASSSYGRRIVKSNKKDHYFHSYTSYQQNRITDNSLSSFRVHYPDLINFGMIHKIDSDIYGNEFVSYVDDIGVIKNQDDSEATNVINAPFKSGNTIDFSENRYGVVVPKKSLEEIRKSKKHVYLKDVSNNTFLPLSSSNFSTIIDKYKSNNTLYDELKNSLLEVNIYEDTLSFKTSSYNVIDRYSFDGEFRATSLAPMILERDMNFYNMSFITNDLQVDDNIIKCNISLVPSFSSLNNCFYYEFYLYDLNKNTPSTIIDRNIYNLAYFEDLTKFDIDVKLTQLKNAELTYNSKLDSYNLAVNYCDSTGLIYIHVLIFDIINNKFIITDNRLYKPSTTVFTTVFTDASTLTAYSLSSILTTPTINLAFASLQF